MGTRLTALALGVPDVLPNSLNKDPLLAPFHDTIPMIRTPHASRFASCRSFTAALHNTPMHGTVHGSLDPDIDPLQTASFGMTLVILAEPRRQPIL